jgi:hypothetical protein
MYTAGATPVLGGQAEIYYSMNTRKSNKNNKRPIKKNKRQNPDSGLTAAPNAMLKLPKTVTQIMPDRMVTRLTYRGFTNFTIPAASQHVARRWIPTAAYDIDPLIGSTTTVGFTEMTALYNSYRVYRSKLLCRFANQTASTAVQGVILPLNQDPTSTPTLGTVQAWLNNPYSIVKLVPPPGGNVVSMSRNMTTEKIYGSKMVYYDDNFAANVNTVPANNWYWGVAIINPITAGSNIVVTVEIDISIDIEFYNRKFLVN